MKRFLIVGAVVLAAVSLPFFFRKSKNNVCKTFEDYYTDRDQNDNCYFNPDYELSPPEVIKRWGYPVEEYTVTTDDGYILTLFRIPYGKNSITRQPGQPVYLQHGYKSNSKCFISTGAKSLGFILADQGFDVWLGNFRGTTYSRTHIVLNTTEEAFWDFSFHEMGFYDFSAQVDLIYNSTTKKTICIGFSLGTSAATIYHTSHPQKAEDKVKIFIKLAPFIFTEGISTFTLTGLKIWKYVAPVFQALTDGQYYTNRFSEMNEALWKFICYPYPIQMKICQVLDMWSFGFDYEQNDPETLPVTLLHLIETSSIKTVSHLSQLCSSSKFQHFDYGTEENLKRYGSPQPPEYDLGNMRVPTYLVRSENDFTSTKQAVERFNTSIPTHVKPFDIYVVKHKNFNHIDFVFAKDVVPLLYNHLVNFLGSL